MTPIERFRTSLLDATVAATRRAADVHEGETLYSFALYTSGESSYVFVTTATEEGLARAAASYVEYAKKHSKKRKGAAPRTLEAESAALRWSPCDSPYHEDLSDLFEEAQEHLDAVWASSEDSDEGYRATTSEVREAMIAALLHVRDERLVPESVVLNLLLGDQSDEERIAYAERLNSPETFARFRDELGRGR